MILQILHIVAPVFGVAGVGYVYGRLRAPGLRDINAVNIAVFTPALIFYALTEQTRIQLDFGLAIFATLFVVFVAGLIGWFYVWIKGQPARVHVPPIMFPNSGNLGLPVAQLAFGDNGLALMVILLVVENTLQFTVGLWILGERTSIRSLARNPMILATIAGFICMAMGWHIPGVIKPGVHMLAEVSIPMMLVSLGIRLASDTGVQWRAGIAGGIASPLAGLAAALLFVWLFQPGHMLSALIILFGVMPPAVLNYLLAEWYDADPRQVAAMVAVGHIIALATIPATLLFVL